MTISFSLSPELVEYGTAIQEWATSQARPYARQADTDHAPPSNWRDIVAACPVPLDGDRRSGRVPPTFDDGYWIRSLVTGEALAYGDIWVWGILGEGIGHLVVKAMGTASQIERWHDPIAQGHGVAAFGLTEPHFGSDTSQVATTATRDGDVWILNGTKMYCTYGAVADYVVVFASTDLSLGPAAIRAFIVEPGASGFRVGKANESKLGIRSWVTSELVFDECVIPVENQLGYIAADDDDGFGGGKTLSGRGGALGALASNKPNMAALGIGLAQASIDLTSGLLHEQRLGFAPRRWSLIEDELDQMNRALERGRNMNFRAQWLQDTDQIHKTEASLSKGYSPPTAERIIRRCMQLLGPEGTSTELLLEKWYRDIKIIDIFEGSGQIQRVIISRSLMGRDAARN